MHVTVWPELVGESRAWRESGRLDMASRLKQATVSGGASNEETRRPKRKPRTKSVHRHRIRIILVRKAEVRKSHKLEKFRQKELRVARIPVWTLTLEMLENLEVRAYIPMLIGTIFVLISFGCGNL